MVTLAEARVLLSTATSGATDQFRDGQWEAMDAIVNRRQRVLLVERTGWGKSMVYFLSTRFLRAAGAGPTLIISPLLALMRNQLEAAARLGLNAVTINSTNLNDWNEVMARVRANEVDLILVSPERLSNDDFMQNCLLPIAGTIQFLVIDEAHCISDWGHDFRPDYQRIDRMLANLPANVAVLATTATANDRVVQDVMAQLGPNTILRRGPLARASLRLQTVVLPNRVDRLVWLAQALRHLPGSGIIYTLTKRDADRVTEWLVSQGFPAMAYYSGIGTGDEDDDPARDREALENMLMRNDIKALVSTNALGMGFDKPDLAFVIHFQVPQSVVHYYQQVGRAGRSIDDAFGILLGGGEEDEEINGFFISQAFPPERQVNAILTALEDAENGLSVLELEHAVNLRKGQIEKVLKMLSVAHSTLVIKQGSRWYRTANAAASDRDRVARLTGQRELEWAQMQAYLTTGQCLMRFLSEALDDPDAEDCGRCTNCTGRPPLLIPENFALTTEASLFVKRSDVPFKPRKQWMGGAFPIYGWRGNIRPTLQVEPGRALSIWRDAGWGRLIDEQKNAGRFSDELVEACVEMIERWNPQPNPTWVTCVPSLRSIGLVPDFSQRLANRLGIPFLPAIGKIRETERQRHMMNSWQQSSNLDGAFAVDPVQMSNGPVLLVDDIVDSRWSLTILGALLRQAGSGPVFPLVLASAAAAGD